MTPVTSRSVNAHKSRCPAAPANSAQRVSLHLKAPMRFWRAHARAAHRPRAPAGSGCLRRAPPPSSRRVCMGVLPGGPTGRLIHLPRMQTRGLAFGCTPCGVTSCLARCGERHDNLEVREVITSGGSRIGPSWAAFRSAPLWHGTMPCGRAAARTLRPQSCVIYGHKICARRGRASGASPTWCDAENHAVKM